MVTRKKTKAVQQLLEELDRPLYERRWEEVGQHVKKAGKKIAVPEALQMFLEALETLDGYFSGGKGTREDLNEAGRELEEVVRQCQGTDGSSSTADGGGGGAGDPSLLLLRQLATVQRGVVMWAKGEHRDALRVLQEGLKWVAGGGGGVGSGSGSTEEGPTAATTTTQLHTCKVFLEGTLCAALCAEALLHASPSPAAGGARLLESSRGDHHHQHFSRAALDSYDASLRLLGDLVLRARQSSPHHHPVVAKAMKTCVERGPRLAVKVGDMSRAVRFCRKILQVKIGGEGVAAAGKEKEGTLANIHLQCAVTLASLLLFHTSNRTHTPLVQDSNTTGMIATVLTAAAGGGGGTHRRTPSTATTSTIASTSTTTPTTTTPSCLPEETLLVCSLARGFTDTWEVSVRSSVSCDPTPVLDLLTLTLTDLGLHAHLVEALEGAGGIRFSQAHPHLWTQFALALVSNGQSQQALAVFRECVRQFPDDPPTLLVAANFAVGNGARPDLCVEWAGSVVERFPGHFLEPRARFLLGRGHWVLSEGETVSRRRQELRRKGLGHLEAAARMDRGDVTYSFHLAACLAESRQLGEAMRETQRSLTLNPGHTGCLHLLSLLLSAEKSHAEALRICDHALLRQPDNFGLLECKVRLEVACENTAGALSACKASLALWRSMYPGDEEVGDGFDDERKSHLIDQVVHGDRPLFDIDDASVKLQDYTNLEIVDPDLASDAGSSQFTASGARAASSLAVASSAPNALQARIWCSVAEVFLAAGKMGDALSCTREARLLSPHSPSVLLCCGRAAQACGREGAAEGLYRSALSLQPSNATALALMGQLMYRGGRLDQAERYLREATSADQLSHEAWYWLGEVLSAREGGGGRGELAADCYRTALELEQTAPLQPFSITLSSLVSPSL